MSGLAGRQPTKSYQALTGEVGGKREAGQRALLKQFLACGRVQGGFARLRCPSSSWVCFPLSAYEAVRRSFEMLRMASGQRSSDVRILH